MRLAGSYRLRQLASAAALAGVVLYAALIPGHIVSEATTALVADELGGALQFICHADADVAGQGSQAPADHTLPQKRCPFCQGLAAFQFAIVATIVLGLLASSRATPRLLLIDESARQGRMRAPQSRGPPLSLA